MLHDENTGGADVARKLKAILISINFFHNFWRPNFPRRQLVILMRRITILGKYGPNKVTEIKVDYATFLIGCNLVACYSSSQANSGVGLEAL